MKSLAKSLLSLMMVVALLTSLVVLPASADTTLNNLFDLNQLTVGWVNDTTSSPDGAFRTSHYIPVASGDVITFGAAVTGQGWHLVVYNSAKNAIALGTLSQGITAVATLDSVTSIMSYTIPSGGAYLRMVADARYLNQYLVTKNQPFTAAQHAAFFNAASDTPADGELINLYNEANAFQGYIDGAGNQVSGPGFITLAPISVAQGDVITFGAAVSTQGFHLITLNSAGTVTSQASINDALTIQHKLDDATSIMSYTAPAGVAAIRMVVDANYKTKYLYTKNQPFGVAEYNAFFNLSSGGDHEQGGEQPVDPTNSLYGKTALFVGDSICYGQWDNEPRQGWAGRIATRYGMGNVTNAGVGGTTISTVREGRIVTQLHNNKDNQYDYVILQGGTNDGWGDLATTTAAPVGKMTASFNLSDFDTSTFAGGLEELFYYAFEYFPDAKIGFMTTFATPLGATQNLGATGDMSAYYNLAVEICQKWGVQCLDLYNDRYVSNDLMQVTTYNCLRDPLHPNPTGYDNLAPYIGDWMSRMVDNATYKAKPFTNKRAIFVGDSISYGHNDTPQGYSWAGRLADSMGIISHNQSCSGWSISTIRGAQIVQMLQKNKDNPYDYVIMQGGINDSWDNAPIGVMTDSYNPDDFNLATFAGALEHLFYSAYQYFPNARLGYIINFKLPSASSDMGVYHDIALKICAKWKVSCYDMYADDGVTNALQAHTLVNMADAGHPNKKGYDILTPFIENWFKTIPYADISSFESKMPDIDGRVVKMPYEKNGVLYVNECENTYGWSGAYSTSLALDKQNQVQGSAALVLKGGNQKLSDTHYVGAMAMLTFPTSADLSGYDTLAFDYYIGADMTGKQGQIQLNFATTGEDGYNTLITIDNKTAGWHTATYSTDLAGFKVVEFDWSKINKLRYTWWNLNNSSPLTDIKIDNIRMYNAGDAAKQAEDVKAVIDAIDAIGEIALDNFKEKEPILIHAEELADALMIKYGNDIMQEVTNAADMIKAREEVTRLKAVRREQDVQAVMDAIDAIGEVTAENHAGKEAPIVCAEQKVADLVTEYGESVKDTIQNLDKLTDARTAFDAYKNGEEPPVPPTPTVIYGDVDGNGTVEATDALEVLKNVVGKVTLTDDQQKAADTDGNGKIEATDALNILKKVVGKIDKFPVEQ